MDPKVSYLLAQGLAGYSLWAISVSLPGFVNQVLLGHIVVVQRVKNLSAMREIQVRSLGGEDPLKEEMAPHSAILAREIPWTEEPGELQSMGLQRVITHNCATEHTTQTHKVFIYIRK